MDASRRVIWWQDLSGRGGHVTQLIEAFRPEVFDNIFNGFPGIWFDGLDDFLSATGFVAADDFTIFVVAGPSGSLTFPPERTTGTAGRTGQCYVLASDNPAGSDAGACLSLGANGVSVFDYGTAYPGGYMPALAVHFLPDGVSTTCPLTIRYVNRPPSIYLCGALLHTGLTSPKDHVFAPNRVGGGDYGPYSGYIAEIFLYDRALSDPDRQAVEGYLQAKYNCLQAISWCGLGEKISRPASRH